MIKVDIRIGKICDPGFVFFKRDELGFQRAGATYTEACVVNFSSNRISQKGTESERNIHILPLSKLCRATYVAEMMPELCC